MAGKKRTVAGAGAGDVFGMDGEEGTERTEGTEGESMANGAPPRRSRRLIHLSVNLMPDQCELFSRLHAEAMRRKVTLANGRRVFSRPDLVQWLFFSPDHFREALGWLD